MFRAKNNALLSFVICLVLLTAILQQGCSVARDLKAEEGVDVSYIKPGISREEAEKVLGTPLREWVTESNIRYCVYKYDRGVPPRKGDAVYHAFMSVLSLGLTELFEMSAYSKHVNKVVKEHHRIYGQMAIAYDDNDTLVAVFDNFGDFDLLPKNGRGE